jgi:hypothetical protein
MQAVYGDQCVDVSTVRSWVRRFRDGELGFKKKTPIFLKDGFQKLVERWRKYTEVRDDIARKWCTMFRNGRTDVHDAERSQTN